MCWLPTEDPFDDEPYWKVSGGHFSIFINHTNSISSTHTHTHSPFYKGKLKVVDFGPLAIVVSVILLQLHVVRSVVGLDACHSKQQPTYVY